MNQEPSKPEQSDVEAVRVEFEKWCRENCISILKKYDDIGEYEYDATANIWLGYQAGLASGLIAREGWQLVPIEPTVEMIEEAWPASNFDSDIQLYLSYKAMLAAAPHPPKD